MKRPHLGIVLVVALVVSLANDVASECRLLLHAFVLAAIASALTSIRSAPT
jgi:hypothetical protein